MKKSISRKLLSVVLLITVFLSTVLAGNVSHAAEVPPAADSNNLTVADDFIVLTGAGASQKIELQNADTSDPAAPQEDIFYTSSRANVATVSDDGTITAVSEGLTDVSVRIGDRTRPNDAETVATIKVTVVPEKDAAGRVQVGLQMYNLFTGGDLGWGETSKDKVIDALRKVASLGYDGVEFANLSGAAGQFYANTGMSISELKAVLEELGLEAPSSHYHFGGSLDSPENIDAIVKANQELGCENLIFAWSTPQSPVQHDTNAQWVEWINGTLTAMKEGVQRNNSNAQVLYHNHGDEFMTMEGTDTLCMDNVNGDSLEIDMYWASRGLNSTDKAVKWASDNADKISFLHIKDGGLDGSIRPWGKGSMPVQSFVDVARKNNIGWVIVENDSPGSYLDHNGLQDAAVSMEYIKNNINLNYTSAKVDDDFIVLTGAGATQSIQTTVSAENTVSYTSSNRNVATVAADGTVTAVAEGLADIAVTINDASGKAITSATVKVTVVPEKDTTGRVKVGLQMYNLRQGGDIGRNETSKDKVIDAMRKIASLGYDGIEFANLSGAAGQFYAETGMSVAELKSVLNELGLETPSSHYHFRGSLDDAANIDAIVKANQELGSENIIFAFSNPSNPVQHETNAKWVEWINSTLAAMQEGVKRNNSNAKVLYHNHGDEFKTMEGTDTLCMDNIKGDSMEIDMYWASRGLESTDQAVRWASDNADKISFLHIKDGGLDGSIRPWGKGSMPVQSFVDVARKNNIGWVIVENDSPSSYLNHNGLQDAEVSMEYIKNNIKLDYTSASDDPVTPPVNTAVKVSGIKVSGMSKKIAAGKKVTLTAAVSPSNAANKAVTWKSSNTKIAKVNSKGVVTLNKKSGGKSVTITATAQDGSGVKGTYKITSMKGKVKKVTITGKKSVKAGKSLKLTGKVTAEKKANKTLKWTTSNKKYATVNSSGKVKTYKAGRGRNVKITATATDGTGKKRTVTIKIKK